VLILGEGPPLEKGWGCIQRQTWQPYRANRMPDRLYLWRTYARHRRNGAAAAHVLYPLTGVEHVLP
jgi:hypothetical protein